MRAGTSYKIVLLIPALLALGALGGCPAREAAAPAPRLVVAQRVAFIPHGEQRSYAGDVHAHVETALSFRIAGKIVSRGAELGRHVHRGEMLAQLDPADAALNAETARAALAAARSDYDIAGRDYRRYGELVQRALVSREAYEQQENRFHTAAAALQQARKAYDLRQREVGYTELRADRDGVVTRLDAEVGQVVAAGQPVLGLAGDGRREVFIAVPERDLDWFRRERDLSVTLWALPGRRYAGRVADIAAAADPATRTFQVKIALPQDAQVQLGMSATVQVSDPGAGVGAVIPMTALYHDGEQPAVWVIDPDSHRIRLQPVAVGGYRAQGVLVSDGLKPGALIVAKGVQLLHAGETVAMSLPAGDGRRVL